MRRAKSQFVSLLLLGVLVPFWILGESAHHAECFGHHHADSASQAEIVSTSCSCGAHSHGSSAPTQDSDSESVSDYHKCNICDFFDQLNVHSHVQVQSVNCQWRSGTVDQFLMSCDPLAVSAIARGPPVLGPLSLC